MSVRNKSEVHPSRVASRVNGRSKAWRSLSAAIAVLVLLVSASPAYAWTLVFTTNSAKQETWYGPTASATIIGTRTSISGSVPGDAVITWARSGTALSANSSGYTVETRHPSGSYRSTGKWRFVIDPSDPGTVRMEIRRLVPGSVGMSEPTRAQGVLEQGRSEGGATQRDVGNDSLPDIPGLRELVGGGTVRHLSTVDDTSYWAGRLVGGEIILIAVQENSVWAAGVTSEERFESGGLALSISTEKSSLPPVYLVPDGITEASKRGLAEIGPNLYRESQPTGIQPAAERASIEPSRGFDLVRIPQANEE